MKGIGLMIIDIYRENSTIQIRFHLNSSDNSLFHFQTLEFPCRSAVIEGFCNESEFLGSDLNLLICRLRGK